jgi:hypothetical protein
LRARGACAARAAGCAAGAPRRAQALGARPSRQGRPHSFGATHRLGAARRGALGPAAGRTDQHPAELTEGKVPGALAVGLHQSTAVTGTAPTPGSDAGAATTSWQARCPLRRGRRSRSRASPARMYCVIPTRLAVCARAPDHPTDGKFTVLQGFCAAHVPADPPFTRRGTTHNREVNDRDDDRLPWWAGRARHAYPDHRCCPDSHRSRLGARCGYCDRRGRGGVREAEWGEAHRVQRAEVPQCPAALSGRASARLAPPTGGQSSRGGCPTRPSAAGYLTRDGFDRDEYPPRLAGGAGLGWSAVATRAAGRLMCATCRVLRTDHTARRLETGSNPSAAAPAFATCFADSLSCSRRPQTGRSRLTGQLDPLAPPKNWCSLVARPERSCCCAHAETRPVQRLCEGERRDSNLRPPGPQPVARGASAAVDLGVPGGSAAARRQKLDPNGPRREPLNRGRTHESAAFGRFR